MTTEILNNTARKDFICEHFDLSTLSKPSMRAFEEYAYTKSAAIKNCDECKLQSHIDKYMHIYLIEYEILKTAECFSGRYLINFERFDGNRRTSKKFDTIRVEINMLSDYEANRRYVKSNVDEIKNLLKYIMETHPKFKRYSNYMKMYRCTLTRESVLVAEFCFKDRLNMLFNVY